MSKFWIWSLSMRKYTSSPNLCMFVTHMVPARAANEPPNFQQTVRQEVRSFNK
ncbi:hypothetical protein HanPSC8_Chr16g0746851 [Helianthus annuus]|nr:hypothetical protein HanPSC8_Chr16g0746851 [Helianthus annuus]